MQLWMIVSAENDSSVHRFENSHFSNNCIRHNYSEHPVWFFQWCLSVKIRNLEISCASLFRAFLCRLHALSYINILRLVWTSLGSRLVRNFVKISGFSAVVMVVRAGGCILTIYPKIYVETQYQHLQCLPYAP